MPTDRGRMSLPHLALAVLVMAIWGTNFVVIKVGLRDFPPFLFALLRFLFTALPFVFFVRRPTVEWRWLALYGVLLGPGQFGLLFYAMRGDISPGLASLVVQVQVFFTIGVSVWLFGERVSAAGVAGMALAAAGLAVIGFHLDASVNAYGVAAVLAAAFCWACANATVKHAARRGKFAMLSFIVWSSLFAIPPLAAMTLVFEGADAARQALSTAGLAGWLAIAWQVVGNMFLGFAAWSWLLARYDAAAVAPFALLIPIFGMASSAWWLAEALPLWKFVAAAMVLGGIAVITVTRPRA